MRMNRVGKKKDVMSAPAQTRVDKALLEANQFNQQILFAAHEGIIVYGPDLRYRIWNPFMERMSGIPAAAVLGRHPLEVFPFLREAGVVEVIEKALAEECPPARDFAFQVPQSGRAGWASDCTAPLRNADGVIIGAVGMVRDMTTRKQAETDLRASKEVLQALTARLQILREEERTRIARAVHDELGQELTGLKMDLRWLEHGLEELHDPRASPLLEKTMAATDLVDTTIKTVQRIATDLRPAVLDKLGLVAAVRREAVQFQEHSGIASRVTHSDVVPQLPAATEIGCFRIFQEAMTNVVRHAAATAVEVDFQTPPDGLVLEIRDNGKGFSLGLAEKAESLGLLGMRERARALGGELTVRPQAEGGTVVRLWIPKTDRK